MGNGDHFSNERRVGFADEIQVMHRDLNESGDSDTIKRSPKTVVSTSITQSDDGGVNSILRTNMGSPRQQSLLSAGPPERRSASPSPMATSFRAAIPFLHGGRLGAVRSQSSTPTSVTSEPAIYRHQPDQRFGFPPPPPPRSSSRNAVGNMSPKSASDNSVPSSAPAILTYRNEFEKKRRFFSSSGEQEKVGEAPTAIVQTNAVDEESRFVKSASSSESVNSQDGPGGQRRRLLGMNIDPEKPPPPPPPRNKQEMLEQRQHELSNKHGQNRFVKFQLPDGRGLAAE